MNQLALDAMPEVRIGDFLTPADQVYLPVDLIAPDARA